MNTELEPTQGFQVVGRISIPLVLAVGSILTIGLLAISFAGRPGEVSPPLQVVASQNISVDCGWVAEASVWEDLNADGKRDANEPPLSGVSLEVDDVTHAHRNIAEPVVSGAEGATILRQFLPGCPSVTFAVRAQAPEGFHQTATETLGGDRKFSFGFTRVGREGGVKPHNYHINPSAGGGLAAD